MVITIVVVAHPILVDVINMQQTQTRGNGMSNSNLSLLNFSCANSITNNRVSTCTNSSSCNICSILFRIYTCDLCWNSTHQAAYCPHCFNFNPNFVPSFSDSKHMPLMRCMLVVKQMTRCSILIRKLLLT